MQTAKYKKSPNVAQCSVCSIGDSCSSPKCAVVRSALVERGVQALFPVYSALSLRHRSNVPWLRNDDSFPKSFTSQEAINPSSKWPKSGCELYTNNKSSTTIKTATELPLLSLSNTRESTDNFLKPQLTKAFTRTYPHIIPACLSPYIYFITRKALIGCNSLPEESVGCWSKIGASIVG